MRIGGKSAMAVGGIDAPVCGSSQGFADQGASNESGVVKNGDFCLFYLL